MTGRPISRRPVVQAERPPENGPDRAQGEGADALARPFCPAGRARCARLAVAALCAATETSSPAGKGTHNDFEEGRWWSVTGTGVRRRAPDLIDPAGSTRRPAVSCHASCKRVPDPRVLLRHAHAPYRRVSNRIEPELATASRDLRMNGATARKDAGGAVGWRWRAGGAPRGSPAPRRTTPPAPPVARPRDHRPASPNIAPRVNTRTPCDRWHARGPDALGSERRQVQSSQQLGATLGQPGGLAGNASQFLPPGRKRPKIDVESCHAREREASSPVITASCSETRAAWRLTPIPPENMPEFLPPERLGSCP